MAKKKFYGVTVGRVVGVFETWAECERQVKGYANAKFKGFKTREEAIGFVEKSRENSTLSSLLASSNEIDLSNEKDSTKVLDNTKEATPKAIDRKAKVDDSPTDSKPPAPKRPRIEANMCLSVHMSFDGGSRGNPGKVAGSGAEVVVVVLRKNEKKTERTRMTISIRGYLLPNPPQTNNQAEYYGMILGLEYVYHTIQSYKLLGQLQVEVSVQGDSKLVIEQMLGQYQVKSEKLVPCFKLAKQWVEMIENEVPNISFQFNHVFRTNNKVADGLANEAMDAKNSWVVCKNSDGEETRENCSNICPGQYSISQRKAQKPKFLNWQLV